MDSGTAEWWRRHGWTIGLLLIAFGIAMSIRTIWTYPVVAKWGALYTYAGGSDSYYHSRVMTYIIETHSNLVSDPMLKFPVGAINPREPLFDWMNAVLGIVFAPFFGGNAVNAGAWFLDLQAPLWAALEIFPIYLIGREVSGRRTGLIAALVYPFFSASIDSSTFGYANYLSFYTFFLLVVIYSYIRTLKAVGHRRYVESYRDPKQFVPALRSFFRYERSAVKWSVFTGVAMGAFALSWQGYTYAIITVAFTLLIAMLIERIRHVDSFGLYVSTWLIGLVAFPMMAPYYLVQHEIKVFLELPIILFFGTLLLLLPFLLLRDVPWVFSIPALVAVVGGGVLALRFLTPTLFTAAVTGDGYFVKNLIYSTVAEAQAPSIDALIVAYGVVTFFLAFVGLVLFAYQFAHQRFKRFLAAFLVFAIISVYLPVSATKFFLVASPAFALLSAEGIHRLLDVGGYPQLRRSVASLTDRTGSFSAFRKSFKARHVLVLALAVGILLPNIWVAIDAGIPSNSKDQAAVQINKSIPSWLKLNASAPGSNYLGAAGSGLDVAGEYDSAAYNWLAQQDPGVPQPQRPAFVSWWDYGFQAIAQGQHPSVADNFQNGIDPAGQFLLAQNESLAIGILATALLQGEIESSHLPTLPPSLNAILVSDGVNVTALHQVLDNPPADYALVVHNPQTYLPVNPSTITYDNAMYLASSYYLADHLSISGVARVYDALEAYTGWSIRYGMVDSRLFPFTGSDTGIFYAPADLTGRVINSEGVPTTFYNVTILGSDGTTYPLGPLPAGVTAVNYNINWSAPFYNTMLYRIYIGYNGTDAGQTGGIPGLTGAAVSDRVEPGWMLQHFEVEYQTGYVCPGVKNASSGAACFTATNRPHAIAVANSTGGTANVSSIMYFQGGESILSYYPGVTLYGRLALPDGAPAAGDRVTIYDGWGIPHMTAVTNATGAFTLVLPPGNDTLNITYGSFDPLNQSDSNLVASLKLPISDALGFDENAPAMVRTFTVLNATVAGQVYWNVAGNKTFSSSDPVIRGAQVVLAGAGNLSRFSAVSDPSGTFVLPDVPPGTYNVTVLYGGRSYNQSATNVTAGGSTNLSLGLTPSTISGTVHTRGLTPFAGATVTLSNASGVYASTTTASTGAYNFTGVAPGTYTVSAVGSGTRTSNQVQVVIAAAGKSGSANLTIASRVAVKVELRAQGLALANATVAFSPQLSFANKSASAVGSVLATSTNVTLATTNGAGVASTALLPARYGVVALDRVDGRIFTAATTLNVTFPGISPVLSLALAPAHTVQVSVPLPATSQNKTAVAAFGPNGTELVGWAGPNDTAVLELPNGSYTFLAVTGLPTAGAAASVALATWNSSRPSTVTMTLTSSVASRFAVGTVLADGKVFPAPNASVSLSAGGGGPTIPAVATPNGSVGFYVPTSSVGSSGGYCLRASAFGFQPNTVCGLSAGALAKLTTLNLTVRPVNVSLSVVGLPANTNVTVNITSESLGGRNVTLSGPSPFALRLPPGVYGVGAKAVLPKEHTVYLPSTVLSTTIPLGATYSNLTLIVVPEINATGKLDVPSGLEPKNVTVALASPLLNTTVNGTNFTKGFRATPANYTATVTATWNGQDYVNMSRVTILSNGTVRPKLVLDQPGVAATLTLTARNGTTVAANTTVNLVSSSGLLLRERAVLGTFNTTVPQGTYHVYANTSVPTSGPNGSFLTNWSTGVSATCAFSPSSRSCAVPMTSLIVSVPLRGTLVAAGGTSPVPGALRLLGPYPSTLVTTISASNGTFSTMVAPGAYYGYAASSGTPLLAGFGRLLALPSAALNITITLRPTWNAVLHLSLANSTSTSVGPANVTVTDAFGNAVTFPGVSVGTTLTVALPAGSYTVNANASGTLYGVAGTAVASASVVLATGNVVNDLPLAVPVAATVSGAVAGPPNATVADGGQGSFAFTVRATGNVPVTIHPVGSPSTWPFHFSFTNVTLQPGANVSGDVRFTVPAGTAVDHAPVVIAFDLPNGSEAGVVSPAPTVVVPPHYGLSAGTSGKALPQVGSTRALLPFYVTDTGNTPETVRLSVVDAPRLASDGWGTAWVVSNSTLASGLLNLTAGQNSSVMLNISATTAYAVAPGSVTVQAAVTNASGTLSSSVALTVPRPMVRTSPGTLGVTGPSVSGGPSPVPLWFVPLVVFVPAIALAVGVATYRWWRTRRWTRRWGTG
ncbi:MAG TPA: carboxypeptidase regulatory-like domain-containing protein [Thermoplasmata archaeon]|nr:carboxypeptidase regulatory-like domain-containing protein [Thermoplasmata archaeon]